jgi:hypothetical protein
VLIVTSILLAYPEGTLRPDHATTWGYVMIAIILLDVLLNMLLFIIATVKLIWFKALRPFYFKFIKGKLCTKSARKEDYLQHTDLSSKEEIAFQKEKEDIFGIQDNRVSSKLED